MIILYVFAILYLTFVLLTIAILQIQKVTEKEIRPYRKFSVIIPIRDEANNIEQLLEDLDQQNYPFNAFEVIIIDDHSSDDGVDKVNRIQSALNYSIQLINLPDSQKGKKQAIQCGINASEFNTIVTTDGDCRLGPDWLMSINNCYDDSAVLVFGVVKFFPEKNLFHKFQALELSALVATGAAINSLGLPGMCNGANFSFIKSIFHEVNGYIGNENLPTGDDEFLLRKVRKKYPSGIRFMKVKEGTVRTAPMNKWNELVNQKTRWASKWRHHKDLTTLFLGIFVFTSNVVFALVLVLFAIDESRQLIWGSIITMKVILEFVLAINVLRSKKSIKYAMPSFVLSILYPFYAMLIAVLSIKGKYVWKQRRY